MKLILVDDEDSVLRALQLLMEALGYEVSVFNSGQALLEALFSGQTGDFVLIDLKMPKMDGLTVLEELKTSYPELKCILMSAHATKVEIEAAKRIGIVGFLAKPFTPDDLKALIGPSAFSS